MSIDKYFSRDQGFPVTLRDGLGFTGSVVIEISGSFPLVTFTSWDGRTYQKYFDDAKGRSPEDFSGITLLLKDQKVLMILKGSKNYASLRFETLDRMQSVVLDDPDEDEDDEEDDDEEDKAFA